jgi:hypothetical protein
MYEDFHVAICHNSVVCPQVSNGGNGLHIGRELFNMLNKQLWAFLELQDWSLG